MALSPKRRTEEVQAAVRFKAYDAADNFLRYAWKYGSLMFVAWCAKETIVPFAGKFTLADFSLVADLTVGNSVRYLVMLCLGLWGISERRLRQKTIARLAPRAEKLELIIDPKRTSSNLTVKGTTRKEDRL